MSDAVKTFMEARTAALLKIAEQRVPTADDEMAATVAAAALVKAWGPACLLNPIAASIGVKGLGTEDRRALHILLTGKSLPR